MASHEMNGQLRSRMDARISATDWRSERRHSTTIQSPIVRPPFPEISMSQMDSLGISGRMMCCSIMVGIGTTGSRVVNRAIQLALAEFRQCPTGLEYLLIDAATQEHDFDPQHFIGLDIDGCGSDPIQARAKFQAAYLSNRAILLKKALQVSHRDEHIQIDYAAEEVLAVYLVGGCAGGTSGGGMDVLVTTVHDALQLRHVISPIVHVSFIGADMALRDTSRTITREQEMRIPQTAEANLNKAVGDIVNPAPITETRPDGSQFSIPAGERIKSLSLIDQSNGLCQLPTTQHLIEMAALNLFLQIFTESGKYVADRAKDNRQLGTYGFGAA